MRASSPSGTTFRALDGASVGIDTPNFLKIEANVVSIFGQCDLIRSSHLLPTIQVTRVTMMRALDKEEDHEDEDVVERGGSGRGRGGGWRRDTSSGGIVPPNFLDLEATVDFIMHDDI
ncbi:MAG: hypothetical protein N3G75_09025 [Methanothrix sp.]|nr:hypothetical protein [Methanothrix sp.]MCX8207950.1 hypothetical protein [Methanothrix sp.]